MKHYEFSYMALYQVSFLFCQCMFLTESASMSIASSAEQGPLSSLSALTSRNLGSFGADLSDNSWRFWCKLVAKQFQSFHYKLTASHTQSKNVCGCLGKRQRPFTRFLGGWVLWVLIIKCSLPVATDLVLKHPYPFAMD